MIIKPTEIINFIKDHSKDEFVLYLKKNIDCHELQKTLDSHLRYASYFEDLRTVQMLVECGANIFINEREPLGNSVGAAKLDIVKYLVSQGENPKNPSEITLGSYPTSAASNGDLTMLKYFTEELKLDWRLDNDAPFRYACYHANLECAQFLYDKGVNIEAEDNWALTHACKKNNYDIVKFLIDKNVDININGNIALANAAQHGSLALVQLLVEQGLHPLDNNQNAMVGAIIECRIEIIDFFISKGCSLLCSNNYILNRAKQSNNMNMIDICLERGITSKYIADNCDEEIKSYLLSKKLDEHMKPKNLQIKTVKI